MEEEAVGGARVRSCHVVIEAVLEQSPTLLLEEEQVCDPGELQSRLGVEGWVRGLGHLLMEEGGRLRPLSQACRRKP